MDNQPAECIHAYVHLETKKVRAERPSIGISAAQDWERTDIFFCEKCLDMKIVKRHANWMEFQDRAPDWW